MTATVLQWSGGKDSTLALDRLRRESHLSVVELQTMVNADNDRSSWHGVRQDVLRAQAAALDVPISFVPTASDAAGYVERLRPVFADYRDRGVQYLAVGDIETEDPDMPRERAMASAGLDPFYPLLGERTADLVEEFLDRGFRATVILVNGDALDRSFLGRDLSMDFVEELPADVDPGGEGGEFHTFVHDGPLFDAPVPVETGDVVTETIEETPYQYLDVTVP